MYPAWGWFVVSTLVALAGRLLTHRILLSDVERVASVFSQSSLRGAIPVWVSILSVIGFSGQVATIIWSVFSINWWAFLPPVALWIVVNRLAPPAGGMIMHWGDDAKRRKKATTGRF
jgi:hypothetical protein